MFNKTLPIFTSLILFLALNSLSIDAQMRCSMIDTNSETCPNELAFKISDSSNAHAEIPEETNYDFGVCCQIPQSISNICETAESHPILRLSGVTNAHVQDPSVIENIFPSEVCLSVHTNLDIVCQYQQITCDSDYTCLAAISARTNSQIADCANPFLKTEHPDASLVCCKCEGSLSGVIEDVDGIGIEEAHVDIFQGSNLIYTSPFTESSGEYEITNILCGTYNVVASAERYTSSTIININLPTETGISSTLDFKKDPDDPTKNTNLFLGSTCEDDCTYLEDNTIHKACAGRNECEFYKVPGTDDDEISKEVCDLAAPGWIRDYSDNPAKVITCPSGPVRNKGVIQAVVICGVDETLVRLTKVVVYKGEPVNMIITVCS